MKCASFTVPHEEGAFGDFGVSKGESGFEGDIESAFSPSNTAPCLKRILA